MTLTSFSFLAFVAAALVLYGLAARWNRREPALLLINFAFLFSFVQSPLQLLPLLAFAGLGYGMILAVRGRQGGAVLASAITLLVALFSYLRQYEILSGIGRPGFVYLSVGLSYILFRIIHVMIDSKEGEISNKIGLTSYLNYLFFFPSFISGPIQRYQDFSAQVAASGTSSLSPAAVADAFARIIRGYMKTVVFSVVVLAGHDRLRLFVDGIVAGDHMRGAGVLYAGAAAAYFVYLYLNFSGYMDIVIGVGRLFGFVLPENFNSPMRAPNVLNFWTRWHMTLSGWFRDYLFNAVMKRLMGLSLKPRHTQYFGSIAFFIAFLAMGMWHGTTEIFLWLALYFGFGVSVNKLYQTVMTNRLGRKAYAALCARRVYHYCCRGLTFTYISIALTSFWMDAATFSALVSRLGVAGVALTWTTAILAAAPALLILDRAASTTLCWREAVTNRFSGGANLATLWMSSQVLLIVSVAFLRATGAPDFVYKAF